MGFWGAQVRFKPSWTWIITHVYHHFGPQFNNLTFFLGKHPSAGALMLRGLSRSPTLRVETPGHNSSTFGQLVPPQQPMFGGSRWLWVSSNGRWALQWHSGIKDWRGARRTGLSFLASRPGCPGIQAPGIPIFEDLQCEWNANGPQWR